MAKSKKNPDQEAPLLEALTSIDGETIVFSFVFPYKPKLSFDENILPLIPLLHEKVDEYLIENKLA